jgi:hypothetical protein
VDLRSRLRRFQNVGDLHLGKSQIFIPAPDNRTTRPLLCA